MADEGSWVGNGHFRFLEDISGGYLRMRMEADLNSFEDSVSSEVNCMRDCDD
jgi:hypothetical protein